MKYVCFYLCLVFFQTLSLHGQQVLSPLTLPEVGDTLRTAFDDTPMGLDIGVAGEDRIWNFSSLQGISSEAIVLDASSGINYSSFPDANQRVEVSPSQEVYYLKLENQISLMGFAGDDPFGIGIQSVLPYTPPSIERKLPLGYHDENDYSTRLQITLPGSDLPQDILDQLPTQSIDSLRVTVNIERHDYVDAWGELTIPSKGYGVLREKRTEYTDSSVEVKLGTLPWSDVTSFVIGSFPELASDTSVNYFFWGDAKEPIAIVDVNPNDENEIQGVTYKFNDTSVDIPYIKRNQVDLIAYPNPAVEEVRFVFRNLRAGKYRLAIFNILGQEISSDTFHIQGNKTVLQDLDKFRRGTYLYSLIDENEKVMTTKRLVVLKP